MEDLCPKLRIPSRHQAVPDNHRRKPPKLMVSETLIWDSLVLPEVKCASINNNYLDGSTGVFKPSLAAGLATYPAYLLDWETISAAALTPGTAAYEQALSSVRHAHTWFRQHYPQASVFTYSLPYQSSNPNTYPEVLDATVEAMKPLIPYLDAINLSLYMYGPDGGVGSYHDHQTYIQTAIRKVKGFGIPIVGTIWDRYHENGWFGSYSHKTIPENEWKRMAAWIWAEGASLLWWGSEDYYRTQPLYIDVLEAEALAAGYPTTTAGVLAYIQNNLAQKLDWLRQAAASGLNSVSPTLPSGSTNSYTGLSGSDATTSGGSLSHSSTGSFSGSITNSETFTSSISLPSWNTRNSSSYTNPCPPSPDTGVPTSPITLAAGSASYDAIIVSATNPNVKGGIGIEGGNATAVTTLSVTNSIISAANYAIYLGDAQTLNLFNCVLTSTTGGNDYCLRGYIRALNIGCCTFTNDGDNKAVFRVYGFTSGQIHNTSFGSERLMLGGGTSVETSDQVDSYGLTLDHCDVACSTIEIYAETHHLVFSHVDFTGSGHITVHDGSHDLTFIGCTGVNGSPLTFANSFFNAAALQATAAARRITIIP